MSVSLRGQHPHVQTEGAVRGSWPQLSPRVQVYEATTAGGPQARGQRGGRVRCVPALRHQASGHRAQGAQPGVTGKGWCRPSAAGQAALSWQLFTKLAVWQIRRLERAFKEAKARTALRRHDVQQLPSPLTGRVDDVPQHLQGAHAGPLIAGVQLGQQEGQQTVGRAARCREHTSQAGGVCPGPPSACASQPARTAHAQAPRSRPRALAAGTAKARRPHPPPAAYPAR